MQYCKNIYKAVRKVYELLQKPCNVRSKHDKWNIAAILFHANVKTTDVYFIFHTFTFDYLCLLFFILKIEKIFINFQNHYFWVSHSCFSLSLSLSLSLSFSLWDIPYSTVIVREYFKNIPLKYCNIARIFIKLLERFMKYCRNLAMSLQNMINGILLQYYSMRM